MNKIGYVYIVANQYRTTLYIGVTSNLVERVTSHKNGIGSVFTNKYNLKDLIYFEEHPTIMVAILREKELKGWKREKKNTLIAQFNPKWQDLYMDLLGMSDEREKVEG